MFVVLACAPDGSPFKQKLNNIKLSGVDLHAQLLVGILDQIRYLTYGLSQKRGAKPKPTDITGKMEGSEKLDYGEGFSIEDMREILYKGMTVEEIEDLSYRD